RMMNEPFRGFGESFGPEVSLGVDVERLAFATALRDRQLAGDAQRVADLCLAGAKLAVELRQAASLDAAAEDLVELLRARRDQNRILSPLVHLQRSVERDRRQLRRCRRTHRRPTSATYAAAAAQKETHRPR